MQFALVLLACMFAVGMCYPRIGDRARAHALRDLEELTPQVDRSALSITLARAAERKLAASAPRLQQLIGVPRLRVARAADAPRLPVVANTPDLSTLQALARATRPDAQISVRGPRFEALAASLRWRLDRMALRGQVTLTRLVSSRPIGTEAWSLEARVDAAATAWQNAFAAHGRSRDDYFAQRDESDALIAKGASKKALTAATRERVAAWEEFEKTRTAMEAARARYDELAEAALSARFATRGTDDTGMLVIATLKSDAGNELELALPVPQRTELVPVFVAAPAALSRLEQNQLWPEIRALAPQAAKGRLDAEASFHLAKAQLLGIELGGLGLLQLLPLVLASLLWLLRRRCRAASHAYSPFGSHPAQIPSAGSGSSSLDRALLLAPLALLFALSALTLLRLEVQPWIAAAGYLVALAQGLQAARALENLEIIRASASRTSMVPLLPVRG